jgi:hypothetical protein
VKDTRFADYQAALRVLKAIKDHKHPLRVDALALRVSAGSSARLRPLEEIAKAIVQAEKINQDRIVGMPDVTQINGPKNIVFWANTQAADLWMRQCYSTGPNLNFELPNQRTDVLAFVELAKRGGFSITKSEKQ